MFFKVRRNSKLFYCIAGVFVILCSLYSIGAFNIFARKNVQKRAYASGMEYSGELLDGRFSGKGTLCFQDGSMYVGGFKMGLFEGDAVYNSINGWSLSGIFENGRLVSGKLVTKDKKEMTIKDGKVMHKNENGWSYSGELNMLGQTGEGTFTYKDGSVYEGNFLVGLSNGLGKFTSADGKISCEGTFKKGRLSGEAEYHMGDEYYKGQFEDGRPNGQGEYYNGKGACYKGSFKDGKFDGNGVLINEDGTQITGVWKDGEKVE